MWDFGAWPETSRRSAGGEGYMDTAVRVLGRASRGLPKGYALQTWFFAIALWSGQSRTWVPGLCENRTIALRDKALDDKRLHGFSYGGADIMVLYTGAVASDRGHPPPPITAMGGLVRRQMYLDPDLIVACRAGVTNQEIEALCAQTGLLVLDVARADEPKGTSRAITGPILVSPDLAREELVAAFTMGDIEYPVDACRIPVCLLIAADARYADRADFDAESMPPLPAGHGGERGDMQ
jgi:hypothetical protein